MSAPGPVREPASSPCQAPPGYWGEESPPAEAPEGGARPDRPGEDPAPDDPEDER